MQRSKPLKEGFITCISQEKGAHRAAREAPGFGQETKDKSEGKAKARPLWGFPLERKGRAESTAYDWLGCVISVGSELWRWSSCVVPGPE